MKEASLFGKKREQLGSSASSRLRKQGLIPCVITRKDGNVSFYSFINDFREFIYSPDTFLVNVEVEGEHYKCLVKEAQFNPLSDEISHVDFLEVTDDQVVKCELPIQLKGKSPGVAQGGRLVSKMRKLKVKGLLKNLPENIGVDISKLTMGKSIKVKEVKVDGFDITTPPNLPIASVEVPRALRGKGAAAAEAEA